MKLVRKTALALLLSGAVSPALAQVGPCVATDPPFLAEGPISAVTSDPAGTNGIAGTVTAMGVTITVPTTAPVTTPTAVINMESFANPTPFPGRTEPGFVGATVIATGCVKVDPAGTNHVYLAADVTSDVNENVMLGVVTSAPTVDPVTSAVSLSVNLTPVSLLQDPRMPAEPLGNTFGFHVVPTTVPVGAAAAVEGYFSNDGSNVLRAFLVEVDGGTLVDQVSPQVSIQLFRCDGDLRMRGAIYQGDADGTAPAPACVWPNNPAFSLRLFNVEANQPINFAADEVDVLNGSAPSAAFCTYDLRTEAAAVCPANVRLELWRNGVKVAEASTTPDAPPANTPPVAAADSYTMTGFELLGTPTTLTVAAPGVLSNDTDFDGNPLTAALVTEPANGEVVWGTTEGANDGAFTYTPEAGFFGTDSFTYQAVDSNTAVSAPVTVTITVNAPANQPPVANADSATTQLNTPVSIPVLANDTDPNGDAVTLTGVTQGLNGAVVINAGGTSVTYTPNASFGGTDTFTYTISDGRAGTATGTVSVLVVQPETLTFTNRLYNDRGATGNIGRWIFRGTSSVLAAHSLTFTLLDGAGQPVAVIGTAAVAGGTFELQLNNVADGGALDVAAAGNVRITSTTGLNFVTTFNYVPQ